MGLTIKCKKTGREMDVSYSGFNRLRGKIADLVSPKVGKHYRLLDVISSMTSPAKEHALKSYDDEIGRAHV